MNTGQTQDYLRQALNVEPVEPITSAHVVYNPQMPRERQCDRAEPYFQAALDKYHYGNAKHITRKSHRLGATAIYHDDHPVGVLKNYEEQSLLCTQTLRAHDKQRPGETTSMKRGWVYSVSDNVTQHASNDFNAAQVNRIEYNSSRPIQEHDLRRVETPHPLPDLKTLSDLLLHADRFIQEQKEA